MTNRVIELVQQILAEQNKPWDEDNETDEQHIGPSYSTLRTQPVCWGG